MAISSNNVQVYTTLSKELVAEIDKDAKENFRTRSQQINMILTEYYKTRMTTDHESEQSTESPENTGNISVFLCFPLIIRFMRTIIISKADVYNDRFSHLHCLPYQVINTLHQLRCPRK